MLCTASNREAVSSWTDIYQIASFQPALMLPRGYGIAIDPNMIKTPEFLGLPISRVRG